MVHAIVFFDESREVLDYKIYTTGRNPLEKKIISEFVDFGTKTLLKKMTIEDELIVSLVGGFLVYITKANEVGCALLLSGDRLGDLPHIVSRKLISEFNATGIVPDNVAMYFKHKDVLAQVDETKQVLIRTISKVIERGEKIEELVAKTEVLSESSKLFFNHTRKMNTCWGCFHRPSWW